MLLDFGAFAYKYTCTRSTNKISIFIERRLRNDATIEIYIEYICTSTWALETRSGMYSSGVSTLVYRRRDPQSFRSIFVFVRFDRRVLWTIFGAYGQTDSYVSFGKGLR